MLLEELGVLPTGLLIRVVIPTIARKNTQARKIAGLMKQHEHDFRAEILNEEVETMTTRAFPKAIADPFLESNYHFPTGADIRQVFVGIDPSGGGTQSKFAIVSIVFVERQGEDQKRRRTLGADSFINPSHPSRPERRQDAPIYDTVVPFTATAHFFPIFFWGGRVEGAHRRDLVQVFIGGLAM
ncbi:MAG: hypothetical protein LC650_04120 [Actinobacteria bacterium]|nr:hypothetical protein [Actinomycetota bacterium]